MTEKEIKEKLNNKCPLCAKRHKSQKKIAFCLAKYKLRNKTLC
jgi:hypothetical protein